MASRPSRISGIFSSFILIAAVCLVPLLVSGYMTPPLPLLAPAPEPRPQAPSPSSPATKVATTTTIAVSPGTITLGDTVTLTATVAPTSGTGVPTGLVTFFDNGTPLGSGTLNGATGNGNDQATFTTALLSASAVAHTITATYQGDANFISSISNPSSPSPTPTPTTVTVNQRASTTALVLSATPTPTPGPTPTPAVVVGQSISAIVTVTDNSAPEPSGTPSTFATTGLPQTGRTGFTATLFADGKVLVAGGTDSSGNLITTNDAEIYSTSGGTFTVTGNLTAARTGALAALLPNGKVLVAGGSTDGTAANALNSAELFDPTGNGGVGTFTTSSQSMSATHFGGTATLLNTGLVLIAGGQDASGNAVTTAELYSPETDTFTGTGSLKTARAGASATLLVNGKVLIAGGSNATNPALTSAELFDPNGNSGAGSFTTSAGSLSGSGRFQPQAALFLSGKVFKVLIAGGQNASGNAVTTADLYDPVADSFTATTHSMNEARANGSAVALPNGTVLLVGGVSPASDAAEFYDPDSDQFDPTGNLAKTDNGLVATLLNNGQVLAVGLPSGGTPPSDAELYTPSFSPLGIVPVTPDPGDSIQGTCTLLPTSASEASTCQVTVKPNSVGSGTHNISATYPADAVHATSNSSAALTVNPAVTSTTVTSAAGSSNPSIFGQSVSFTATVTDTSTGSTDNPTGSVQFVVDGSNFGLSVPLTPGSGNTSTATSQVTTTLSVAGSPHTVVAKYVNADGNFTNSDNTATPFMQAVTTASTSTAVTSATNPSVFGQQVAFTATVTDISTGSTANPTGSVQFAIDGVNFGSPVTLAPGTGNTGTATSALTTATQLSTGSHSITAVYTPADTNFSGSNNNTTPFTQMVNAATTSTAVTLAAGSVNPSVFGQQVAFTATVTDTSTGSTANPTGSVQFAIDGVSFGSPVILMPGAGNTSTATSGLTTATQLSAGSHSITAIYTPANSNFSGSNNNTTPFTQMVNAATTSTAVALAAGSVNPSVFGQQVAFTATVTDISTGSTANPTGSVQFAIDGVNFGSPVTLAPGTGNTSTATSGLTTATQLSAGSHSITATFIPSPANFSASNNNTTPFTQTVNAATTSTAVTLAAGSVNPSVFGQQVAFTATVTDTSTGSTANPTGSVQFAIDGVNFGSPVTLTAGTGNTSTATSALTTATQLSAGSHSITASFIPSPANFSASNNNTTPFTQTVNAATTSTAVTLAAGSVNPSVFGQQVAFTATVTDISTGSTANPTGSVQFAIDGVNFGSPVTLTAGTGNTSTATSGLTTATQLSAGSHSITASFIPSPANFLASNNNSTPFTQAVNAATTSIGVSSSSNPSVYGQSVTFTATITDTSTGSIASPTGKIQFVVDGAPFGALVSLSPATSTTSAVTSGATMTLTVNGGVAHTVSAAYTNSDGNFISSGSNLLSGGQLVTPAHLTVTADTKSKVYDGLTFTAFTATLTGFVNNETAAVVSGNAAFTGAATTGIKVNTYTITPTKGSLSAANYDFPAGNFVNGTLTVTSAPLTVNADNQTKTYNALPFTAFTAHLTGFVHGETEAGLRGSGDVTGLAAFTGPAVTGMNAGTYTITPNQGTLAATNYNFPQFDNGTLTITKANTISLTTGLATPLNDPTNGASFSFLVIVTSTTGGTPTGQVQFTDDKNSSVTTSITLGSTCPAGTPATASCATFNPSIGQLTAGSQTITASYQGDGNFNDASSGSSPSTVEVTVIPAVNTSPGQNIPAQTITFETSGLSGQTINLNCNVQAAIIPANPQFPTCSLSANTLPANGTMTVNLSTSLASSAAITGAPVVLAQATKPVQSRPFTTAALLSMPGIGLLGLVLLAGTKRNKANRRQVLLGLMLMLFLILLVAGCGGGFNNPKNLQPPVNGSTPTGTYLVTVVGTDAHQNKVVVATIPLNVQF